MWTPRILSVLEDVLTVFNVLKSALSMFHVPYLMFDVTKSMLYMLKLIELYIHKYIYIYAFG
jgi:hypothetical protein